jgi:hypothetical protein
MLGPNHHFSRNVYVMVGYPFTNRGALARLGDPNDTPILPESDYRRIIGKPSKQYDMLKKRLPDFAPFVLR